MQTFFTPVSPYNQRPLVLPSTPGSAAQGMLRAMQPPARRTGRPCCQPQSGSGLLASGLHTIQRTLQLAARGRAPPARSHKALCLAGEHGATASMQGELHWKQQHTCIGFRPGFASSRSLRLASKSSGMGPSETDAWERACIRVSILEGCREP